MASTVDPFTVVTQDPVTREELEARIWQTRADHADVLQAYHEVWYHAKHTWSFTQFLGVTVMKAPNDLWAYQDLITRFRPRTIIETGTCAGGSALWFAFLMDALDIDGGRVWTVDYQDKRKCDHPRVRFVQGDSTDPQTAALILAEVQYPLLVSLDADHSEHTVSQELAHFAPALHVGDWLVVEDTNISWEGCGDRGARGALEDYLRTHPGEFRQDIFPERWLYSCAPGGWLQRVADASSCR